MIGSFVEAKRRLTWEARLDCSSLQLEADEGDRSALWIFDSIKGPDGYALRNIMLDLARSERLKLFSFGPRGSSFRKLNFRMMKAASWNCGFHKKIGDRIQEIAVQCSANLFVVGASKGTFAAAIPAKSEIWEVQHGLLDPSYFPLRANRFFTRSTSSRALIATMYSPNILAALGNDLAPPKVTIGHLARASSLVCYSKNPGGGCTAAELAKFEKAVIRLAERLNLPLTIKLHPRDNILKLILRHGDVRVARYLVSSRSMLPDKPRLVLSSFSTALTTETHKGDLLLNVAFSIPNPIISAEYAWLPTVYIADLEVLDDLPVMERT